MTALSRTLGYAIEVGPVAVKRIGGCERISSLRRQIARIAGA
jgi:hypothetical protein